jgi:hypothetical protein
MRRVRICLGLAAASVLAGLAAGFATNSGLAAAAVTALCFLSFAGYVTGGETGLGWLGALAIRVFILAADLDCLLRKVRHGLTRKSRRKAADAAYLAWLDAGGLDEPALVAEPKRSEP